MKSCFIGCCFLHFNAITLFNRKDVSGANHIEQFYSEVVTTHVPSSFSLTHAHKCITMIDFTFFTDIISMLCSLSLHYLFPGMFPLPFRSCIQVFFIFHVYDLTEVPLCFGASCLGLSSLILDLNLLCRDQLRICQHTALRN